MYMGVAGACAEQAANAGGGGGGALSATVTDPSPVFIATFISVTSNPGEISSTVTVSGGTSPYTFSWKLKEINDPDNILSIATQGTTNTQTYDTATITSSAIPGGFPPPLPGEYRVECEVTDSASTVVTALSNNFVVESV